MRDKRKIYVLSFANIATGGIELCHQLVYKLNLLGFDASIVYIKKSGDDRPIEVKEEYLKYQCPFLTELSIDESGYYIIPEGLGTYFNIINSPNKIFWWLSVDNLSINLNETELQEWMHIPHLVQSEYARMFLRDELHISEDSIYWLSDYINSEYLTEEERVEGRENLVLFNPFKGSNESAMLFINSSGKIKWQALRDFSTQEMKKVMCKAKVYIDFGNHPGKDRIPREAALSGLCVITNKKGAAKNPYDVEIPEVYKFEEFDALTIINKIYEICDNFEECRKDFEHYIKKTKREFQQFECDVFSVFYEILNVSHVSEGDLLGQIREQIECEQYEKAFQLLIKHKCINHQESLLQDILETYIRIGLNELDEAKYVAFEGLRKDETCYELYMLLTKIYLNENNMEKAAKYKDKTIEYCRGTEDEEFIQNFMNTLFNKYL